MGGAGESLGQVVRGHRERAGLTQEALSQRSGVSVRAIRDLEACRVASPRRSSVALLADALGLAAEDLHGQHPVDPLWLGLRPFLDDLVGRDRTIDRLVRMIPEARLVTVTGPGGVGKTTAALWSAQLLSPGYRDGVVVVDLGVLGAEPGHDNSEHVELLAGRLLSIRGVSASGFEPSLDVVTRALTGRRLLLLDNAEHVPGSCALLVDHVRRACPDIDVLVTSRRPLELPGETIFELGPLGADDSLELLLRRAAQNRSEQGQRLGGGELAGLCQCLGGLPLAIELAASRLRAMTPAVLLDRIRRSPAMLRWSNPGALAHQRALATTIDWSVDLLPKDERLLLTRLAVFSGPFTLDAVEQVCGAEPLAGSEMADLMADLVRHSLVQLAEVRDAYRILMPVRDYLLGVADALDLATIRERHLEYYARLAAGVADAAIGRDANLAGLRYGLPDVCAALRWGLAENAPAERVERATLFLAEARALWGLHGISLATQAQLTEQALAREHELSRYARVRLHAWMTTLGFRLGRWANAWRHLSCALELAGEDLAERETRIELLTLRVSLAGQNLDPRTTQYALEAADEALAMKVPRIAIPAVVDAVSWLVTADRCEQAQQLMQRAAGIADGSRQFRRAWDSAELYVNLRLGRFGEVDALAAEVLADDLAHTVSVHVARRARGLARALQGQFDDARADFDAALESVAQYGNVQFKAALEVCRALVDYLAGDHTAALVTLRAALQTSLSHQQLIAGVRGLTIAAAAAYRIAHPQAAEFIAHDKRCREVSGIPIWPLTEADCAQWYDMPGVAEIELPSWDSPAQQVAESIRFVIAHKHR